MKKDNVNQKSTVVDGKKVTNQRTKAPKRLKKYRMDRGLTIYTLADELGIHYSTVSFWENGVKFPRQGKMMELEDYFDKSYRDLFKDLTEEELTEIEARRAVNN